METSQATLVVRMSQLHRAAGFDVKRMRDYALVCEASETADLSTTLTELSSVKRTRVSV